MNLINFLNIETNEIERFKVVIHSLEIDMISPLVKNIFNRFKEVDSCGSREERYRKDYVKLCLRNLLEDGSFLL